MDFPSRGECLTRAETFVPSGVLKLGQSWSAFMAFEVNAFCDVLQVGTLLSSFCCRVESSLLLAQKNDAP